MKLEVIVSGGLALVAAVVLIAPRYCADSSVITAVSAQEAFPNADGSRYSEAKTDGDTAQPRTSETSEEATGDPAVATAGHSLIKAIDDWTNVGLLAGFIGFINFLINLTKIRRIREWFEKHQKKWMLPYISMGLGGLSAALTAYIAGASIANALILGVMAGMGATGLHEAVNKRKAENRQG